MSLRVVSFDLLKGVPVSLGSSFNSQGATLNVVGDFAIQLVFTGSPVGSFSLQACNEYPGEMESNGILIRTAIADNLWTDVTGSAQAISAAGNHMWNVGSTGYQNVRFVWTYTSGSGSLVSARIYLKRA